MKFCPFFSVPAWHQEELEAMRDIDTLKWKGLSRAGNFGTNVSKPHWYDDAKFARGQKFFQENIICVFLSHLFSIVVVLSVPRILKALMYTKKSGTPESALKRYISTIRIVMHWYNGNLWDCKSDSQRSLLYTVQMHKQVADALNSKESQEFKREKAEPKTDFYKAVRVDLRSCQRQTTNSEPADLIYFNQWDLQLVQFSFVGPLVNHPERYGLKGVSQEDLTAFIHFWRVAGHLMGITDEFNICDDSLEQTKKNIADIEQKEILPYFSSVDARFELMASALMEGLSNFMPFVSYPCILLYLLETMGGQTKHLHKRFTFKEKLLDFVFRFAILAIKYSFFVKHVCGVLFKLRLDLIEGKAPRWLPIYLQPNKRIKPTLFSR